MANMSPEAVKYMQEHAGDDKRGNIYACATCCIVLPSIAVILRFLSRRKVRAPLKADDYLVVSALVIMIGMEVDIILATYAGLGRHIIFARNPVLFAKTWIAGEITYVCIITSTKFSILFLYHRLFPSKQLKNISIVVAVLVLGYSIALVVVAFVQCIPLSKLWDPTEHGVCINTGPPYVTTAVMNVATDIFILSLPVKRVWRLQMKTTRKLQIIGLFLLGGVVCIFGIIRSVAVNGASNDDQAWDGVQGAIWSSVEPATAIISACLPTFRPLFRRHAQESEDRYISKHQTVTVTSAQVPLDRMQLSAPSPTYKVWAGTRAPSHGSDLDEELLARSENPEGASM